MKSAWTRTRWYIAAAAVPIAVALFFFLKAHVQWK
jgi:hypothetical protein